MLFAAGFGTRMAELTRDRPKPLIEVAGRPLIDHTLDLVRDISPARIVANTHYRAEQMDRHLRPLGVLLSPEQPDILETGGGLRAALPLLGRAPVYTMNTDAIWAGPNPLRLLQRHWQPDRMDGLLVCVPAASTVGHAGSGDFTLATDGHITRGPGWVYGGAQIIKTERLAEINTAAFSLNRLWDLMLRQHRLFALSYPGKWCDVGRPEGIGLAEDLLRNAHV